MKAVIPVAGEGTRLRPHTHTVPKPLLRVAGKAILGHILDDVVELGIRDVVLIVGYRGQHIVDYVKANYDLNVSFVEQGERLGLGHAIYLTREHVGDEPVLVLLGDTIFKGDFARIVGAGGNYLGVKEVPDPERFGVVEVEDGRIVNLVEKPAEPRSNLAIVGIYCIEDGGKLYDALDTIISEDLRTRGEYQLTDALNLMIKRGIDLRAFEIDGWYDCGKAETLLETNRDLLEMAGSSITVPGSIIIDPVNIAEDVTIEASVIGPYVSISGKTVVRQSIIRNSILGSGALVEDALLDSSLIGDNAVVRGLFKKLNVGDSSEIDFT
jgi:glucose-1-phosphate thymidylyltransferase